MPDSNGLDRPDRARQWTMSLAVATSASLAFLGLSGLSIWLLPFSVANQVLVLAHTVLGAFLLVPCVWYLLRHWLSYRTNQMTHLKLLGYLGVFAFLACGVSGIVLTWQAVAGTAISYAWDAVHIVTTIAVLAFVLPHLVLIVVRDLRARAAGTPTPVEAAAAHGRRVAIATAAALVLVGLVAYAYTPPRLQAELPADYSYKYGKDRPFAPSLATTATGKAFDQRLLAGSLGCGTAGCHEQIVHEWTPSAHRYSAMDPAFQAIQTNMARQNGPESTRYCGGCHDPISLFSGSKNLYTEQGQLTALQGYQEGVSCLTCHSVREVDVKGNANFKIGQPARYMFELEYDAAPREVTRRLRDFLIRAYPRAHVRSLSKTLFKTPEYCAGCHKQFVDKEINNVGWVQLQNQYDNWRKSKWNHPKDAARTVECRECHMPLVDSTDPASGDAGDYNRSAGDHKHRSHRFLGANQMIPALLKLPGWQEHVQLVEKWLQGKRPIPEIASKWAEGSAVALELLTPESVRSGETLLIKAVVTSNKVGHDYPTGPLDIIQSWVELIVTDDAGRVVFSSGIVDARHFIQPGSFIFKAEPVDQYGNLIDRHNLWEMVGVRHRRALFPGFSDTAEFEVDCPDLTRVKKAFSNEPLELHAPAGTRTLTIAGRLLYRKIDQYLINFVFGADKGLTSPITEMASATRVVSVLGPAPKAASAARSAAGGAREPPAAADGRLRRRRDADRRRCRGDAAVGPAAHR